MIYCVREIGQESRPPCYKYTGRESMWFFVLRSVVYDRIEVFNSQVSPESTKAMSEWCMGQQKKKNKAFTVVV